MGMENYNDMEGIVIPEGWVENEDGDYVPKTESSTGTSGGDENITITIPSNPLQELAEDIQDEFDDETQEQGGTKPKDKDTEQETERHQDPQRTPIRRQLPPTSDSEESEEISSLFDQINPEEKPSEPPLQTDIVTDTSNTQEPEAEEVTPEEPDTIEESEIDQVTQPDPSSEPSLTPVTADKENEEQPEPDTQPTTVGRLPRDVADKYEDLLKQKLFLENEINMKRLGAQIIAEEGPGGVDSEEITQKVEDDLDSVRYQKGKVTVTKKKMKEIEETPEFGNPEAKKDLRNARDRADRAERRAQKEVEKEEQRIKDELEKERQELERKAEEKRKDNLYKDKLEVSDDMVKSWINSVGVGAYKWMGVGNYRFMHDGKEVDINYNPALAARLKLRADELIKDGYKGEQVNTLVNENSKNSEIDKNKLDLNNYEDEKDKIAASWINSVGIESFKRFGEGLNIFEYNGKKIDLSKDPKLLEDLRNRSEIISRNQKLEEGFEDISDNKRQIRKHINQAKKLQQEFEKTRQESQPKPTKEEGLTQQQKDTHIEAPKTEKPEIKPKEKEKLIEDEIISTIANISLKNRLNNENRQKITNAASKMLNLPPEDQRVQDVVERGISELRNIRIPKIEKALMIDLVYYNDKSTTEELEKRICENLGLNTGYSYDIRVADEIIENARKMAEEERKKIKIKQEANKR